MCVRVRDAGMHAWCIALSLYKLLLCSSPPSPATVQLTSVPPPSPTAVLLQPAAGSYPTRPVTALPPPRQELPARKLDKTNSKLGEKTVQNSFAVQKTRGAREDQVGVKLERGEGDKKGGVELGRDGGAARRGGLGCVCGGVPL